MKHYSKHNLTHCQKKALLAMLSGQRQPGRQFIAWKNLVSMGLASTNAGINYDLTIDGLRVARQLRESQVKETKAERIERLYRESMESPTARSGA